LYNKIFKVSRSPIEDFSEVWGLDSLFMVCHLYLTSEEEALWHVTTDVPNQVPMSKLR